MCYGVLKEKAYSRFACYHVDGLEADDVLGIWSTSGKFGDTIIVSDDKDMQTLPTTIYRDGEVKTISEDHANYYWLFQTLTGDTADGYPGCPGIGPVKAEKILNEFWVRQKDSYPTFEEQAAWEAVVRTYEAAGLTKEDALVQARLSRILRASDWTSVNREPILWTPPTSNIE